MIFGRYIFLQWAQSTIYGSHFFYIIKVFLQKALSTIYGRYYIKSKLCQRLNIVIFATESSVNDILGQPFVFAQKDYL